MKSIKIEDLKSLKAKKFNKDELLVIFVPDYISSDEAQRLLDTVTSLGLKGLFLPNSYDIKEIHFVGIGKKKVNKIEMKDDKLIVHTS